MSRIDKETMDKICKVTNELKEHINKTIELNGFKLGGKEHSKIMRYISSDYEWAILLSAAFREDHGE